MKPVVISFYTNNAYYVKHAARLVAQCERLGYHHYIVNRKYGDNWLENCRKKPMFILEMLGKLNRPVLWVDVDCEILRPLDFEIGKPWANMIRAGDGQPQSNVHYVEPSAANRAFIATWIQTMRENNLGDHLAFVRIHHLLDSAVIPDGYVSLGISPWDDNVKLAHVQ